MTVRGIESMTLGTLVDQVKQGGRFIVFHWCVGLLYKTVYQPSVVYFVPPGKAGRGYAFWPTLGTLLTGWWAVPLGPWNAIGCIRENLRGGRDITASVLRTLVQTGSQQAEEPAHRLMAGESIREPATSHAA